jgi:hypothetical protein
MPWLRALRVLEHCFGQVVAFSFFLFFLDVAAGTTESVCNGWRAK